MEEWRRVRRHPNYAISNLGNVKRVFPDKRGKKPGPVKPYINELGYHSVPIHPLLGKPRRHLVHRLVCEAFNGPPPSSKHEVAHGDGNPGNNRAENLRWATRKENMADCVLHGTLARGRQHGRTTKPHKTPRGERHGHSKLSETDVLAIRAEPAVLGSGVRLAKQYGVSPALICIIRAGRAWQHLGEAK